MNTWSTSVNKEERNRQPTHLRLGEDSDFYHVVRSRNQLCPSRTAPRPSPDHTHPTHHDTGLAGAGSPLQTVAEDRVLGKATVTANGLVEGEDKQNQTRRTCSENEAEREKETSSHMRTDQSL